MKRKKLDLSPEKKIITYLITSEEFAKQIMPIFKPMELQSEYAQVVGSWIKEFYDQFKTVPNKAIQDIYREKRAGVRDEDTSDLIADFLAQLSKEYDEAIPNNVEFSVIEAEKYLNLRSLEMLIEDLQDSVQKNDVVTGQQYVANYKRVDRATGEGVSIAKDYQEIINAFDDEEETLLRFPGILGDIIGDLPRGGFFSFFAPQKRGKTTWLWFTAELAQKRGLKVVFFSLEMTKKQILRRAWRSMTATPRKAGIVKIPYFEDMDDGSYAVRVKEVEKEPCDLGEVKEKQKIMRKLYRGGDTRIIPLLGYGATVATLEAHLDNLNFYDNFVPDLIVIDYADLLHPSKKAGKEERHKLDDIWKGLRNISLSRNLLVVTASQTNKQTFDRDIRQGDGSEDSRKIGHITTGVAINQKKSEIDLGIVRVAQLVAREERATTAQAIVLQCLDIGKPYIDSRIYKSNDIDEKRKK